MNDLDAVPSHAQRDDPRAAVDQRLQLARPWPRLDEVVAADQTARGLVPACVLLRKAADGVGAERAVGGISADDVARLAVAHEVDALLVDEQHGGSLDRLGGIRHVALPRRGERMLDDPTDVLGLEPQHWHHLLLFSCGQMCSAVTLCWDQSPWQSGPTRAGAGFAGPSAWRRPWTRAWRSSGVSARPRNRRR